MIKPSNENYRRSVILYMVVLALAALGAGLSDTVLSNYFKDAYQVTALQRGLIEIPREIPGFIGVFIVSWLAFLGDLRIAILAQTLMVIGLLLLGLLTPAFSVMLVFIFIHSLGGHLWYPLQDTLGLHMIRDNGTAGKLIGRFKGISTAFGMVAGIIVYIGFRSNIFSFTTPVKTIFIIAMVLFSAVLFFLFLLKRQMPDERAANAEGEPLSRRFGMKSRRIRLVFHREYRFYYALAVVFGVQKQIMFVFAPWVLIDLLNKKADTLALLTIAGSFIGIFFIPALGRWVDRFGIKKMLYVDAFSFIMVYILYGLVSAGFHTGFLAKTGLPVILAFILFVIDRMSMQMGLIRSLYLRNIAIRPEDIAPTLTLGQSMDHVVSITCAALGGLVWSIWGPQYVFFLAAMLSVINYIVARMAVIRETPA
ncbi:MAG: MFS transporter [Bacillota bacterium]|nr:MFS transporter [Bacillota bacterium]